MTYGTPSWIWSVVVDDSLYVRAYHGTRSRWYRAALQQTAGRITAAGMIKDVAFEPAPRALNDRIDEAHRAKYLSSPYLESMIGAHGRRPLPGLRSRGGGGAPPDDEPPHRSDDVLVSDDPEPIGGPATARLGQRAALRLGMILFVLALGAYSSRSTRARSYPSSRRASSLASRRAPPSRRVFAHSSQTRARQSAPGFSRRSISSATAAPQSRE